jgi:hypothetical protein
VVVWSAPVLVPATVAALADCQASVAEKRSVKSAREAGLMPPEQRVSAPVSRLARASQARAAASRALLSVPVRTVLLPASQSVPVWGPSPAG